MNREQTGIRALLVGAYAWMAAVFFGAILLDIVYANLLEETAATPALPALFSTVSDFLLLIGFLVILAAFVAITLSWKSRRARTLFAVSLGVLSLEFMLPIFVAPFLQSAPDLNIGPWLRLVPAGLASVLAFVALHRYARHA